MAAFVASLVLAGILGFAAHRASLCTVRAVAEVMHSRSAYMAASIGKSMLWILAVTIPGFWLAPSAASSLGGWPLTVAAVTGGFLFGLGAGINGACAYSTMARLVDGEVGMVVAVSGFALGVYAFVGLVDAGWVARPSSTPAAIANVLVWASVLSAVFLAWAIWEGLRLWRTRPPGEPLTRLTLARQYRLSSAAMIIGLAGALIFLLFGSAGYSSTYQLVIEGALGVKPWPTTQRWLLLVAILIGMAASTIQRRGFRVDWRPRPVWLRNFAGGGLMGLGTALTAGGNDNLILYGIPNLSPHALPAFAALAIGVAIGLIAMRALFGTKMQVSCRNDVYVSG